MAKMVLVSHGGLAQGLLDSASMIIGASTKASAVSLLPQDSPEMLGNKLREAIRGSEDEELLFLVDVWGGTPFHQVSMLVAEAPKRRAFVAGVNLPLLLEAMSQNEDMRAHELARWLVKKGAQSIRTDVSMEAMAGVEKWQETSVESVETASSLKVVMARVDSRLLHGQVVTSWVQATRPNRIWVVSDRVSRDALRKKLIEQAAPPGIKVHVIPFAKLLAVKDDPRFGGVRVLLLFETIQDALSCISAGLSLDVLNIGSLAHREGKVAVNRVLSLDEKDVEAFEQIQKRGIQLDVRKVVSDVPESMDELLLKAKQALSKQRSVQKEESSCQSHQDC